MKLCFFAIPVLGPDDAAATLNPFLAGHRILEVRREFVADGLNSHWAICVAFGEPQTNAGRADLTASRPAFAAPELESGSEDPFLNRPAAPASSRPAVRGRFGPSPKRDGAGVLVRAMDVAPNARRPQFGVGGRP